MADARIDGRFPAGHMGGLADSSTHSRARHVLGPGLAYNEVEEDDVTFSESSRYGRAQVRQCSSAEGQAGALKAH